MKEPDWYWPLGLHDAKITQFNDLLLPPARRVLEIDLDCSNAIYERDIRKIRLYDYRLLAGKLPEKGSAMWWMCDILTALEDGTYRLALTIITLKDGEFTLEFAFTDAETERK